MTTKVCSKCKCELPLSSFCSNKSRKDGKQTWCAECGRAQRKTWIQANPEKVRNHSLKKRYGISLDRYLEMLEAQNGRCAICGTDVPGGSGSFHVDHCHDSGKVRDLLCNNCNLGLGYFKDNESILLKAALYLNTHHDDTASSN